MNKVILLGYLSRDPELREFPEKNIKVAKITVAVSDERNYAKSYFFNCSAFAKTADYIMSNLKKGDFVSIDGNLTNNNFINNEGKKITYTEIIIQSIRNLGRRAKADDGSSDNNIDTSDENVAIDELITNPDVMKSNFVDNQDVNNNNEDDEVNWDDD